MKQPTTALKDRKASEDLSLGERMWAYLEAKKRERYPKLAAALSAQIAARYAAETAARLYEELPPEERVLVIRAFDTFLTKTKGGEK